MIQQKRQKKLSGNDQNYEEEAPFSGIDQGNDPMSTQNSRDESLPAPPPPSAITPKKRKRNEDAAPRPSQPVSNSHNEPMKFRRINRRPRLQNGVTVPLATLEQKVHVVNWHSRHGDKSLTATVEFFKSLGEFSISVAALARWMKNRTQLRSDFARTTHLSQAKFKTGRPAKEYYLVDHCLMKQWEQWELMKKPYSGQDLKDEWMIYLKLCYPDVKLPEENLERKRGWLQYFMIKNKYRREVIGKFWDYLKHNVREESIDERDRLRNRHVNAGHGNFYHFDEFIVTSRIVHTEHIQQKFIVGLGVNALCEFLPPLIIGADRSLEHNEFYFQSNSGRMSVDIFHRYLTKLNKYYALNFPNKNIVLLIDRLFEHVVRFDDFKHIDVCWLNSKFQSRYSNLDDFFSKKSQGEEFQPLNLGIVKNFKLYFKANLLKHYLNSIQVSRYLAEQDGVENFEMPRLYVTNQMLYELILSSYNYVKSPLFADYIKKCWQNSTILPNFQYRRWRPLFNEVENSQLEVLLYKLIRVVHHCGYLANVPVCKLDDLIFPRDEQVTNQVFSRLEIVSLAKADLQYIERPYQLGDPVDESSKVENPSVRQAVIGQLEVISPLIFSQLKPFFEENVKMFPRSKSTFETFMNAFVDEAMDYQYSRPSEEDGDRKES